MVSTLRLYVLRFAYFMIFLFLSTQIWPNLLQYGTRWTHMHGVGASLLAAMAPLMLLGVRYPLRMLPIMLFELMWKTIWVFSIALPLRSVSRLNADMAESWNACTIGIVIVVAVIPWSYVWATYVKAPRDGILNG